ncbi:Hypothetical predicted protein [Paramuricea clavata]|uniref:Uncharacterized protein n=1 Tax=Paramuricea clavata TaxID=317549 RepID=A0A6S7FUP6_PARCT|nr:Hypothetical predicted protein [Paramuricea clavata]
MNQAPKNVHRFCDISLNENERKVLVRWLRNLEDKTSSQYLQIVFSFSIPSGESLAKIKNLEKPIISAGAGTGYWEYLLTHFYGVDVIAFDSNTTYPENMHYMTIQKGRPDMLKNFRDRALFLAWPDKDEESTFSLDCLHHYDGDIIIHVGELYGETFSNNPWGQSTSRIFQLELGETFRCVYRKRLPSWPGYMDSLSIWWKIGVAVDCDGGMFCHVPGFETIKQSD